jgi:hypothetical protein
MWNKKRQEDVLSYNLLSKSFALHGCVVRNAQQDTNNNEVGYNRASPIA